MTFEITGAREIQIAYRDAPALIHSTAQRVMQRLVGRLHSYLVIRKLSGSPLKARTSNLVRAVFSRVELSGQDLVGRVGIDQAKAIYGRIHELGGTITPKSSKFLTIPVGRALTPKGAARFDAREFIAGTRGGGTFHGFTGSFVNKNRTAILGVRPSGTVEAVFLLRDRVTIPKRRPLGETLDENRDAIVRALETGVVDAVTSIAKTG